jgi:Family of unknown function (DUF5681)
MARRSLHKETETAHAQDVNGADYEVGYRRPPQHTRFKRGQSGNPKGRRPGRPNMKTVIQRVLTGKEIEALLRSQLEQGKNGNVASAALVLGYGAKAGLLAEPETAPALLMAGGQTPANRLFENIDRGLLCDDELIELSRLAAKIDLGGDITALSNEDFARLRAIVNKGRGKDITPHI